MKYLLIFLILCATSAFGQNSYGTDFLNLHCTAPDPNAPPNFGDAPRPGLVPGSAATGNAVLYCDASTSSLKVSFSGSAYAGVGGGSGTVSANSGSAGAFAFYAAAGGSTTVGPDANLVDTSGVLVGSAFQVSSSGGCNSTGGYVFSASTNSGFNFGGSRVNICQTGVAVASFNAGLGVGNGNIMLGNTAPTISAGFGTSPSVPNNNGTGSFTINVGTGGTASTGTIGLPAAAHGWTCTCTDVTTNSSTVFACKQTGAGTTTTAPIGEFTAAGAAQAWTSGDVLTVSCLGY